MPSIRSISRPALAAASATGLLLAGPAATASTAAHASGIKALAVTAHQRAAAHLHAADTNAVADPSSPVLDANGNQVTQPKAQMLASQGTDDGTNLAFVVKTAQFADPSTDPGWQSIYTGFDWEIDTTVPGADQYDAVLARQTAGGPVQAVMFRNTTNGKTVTSTPVCTGTFSTDSSSSEYAVQFPATCISSVQQFRFNTLSSYDSSSTDTTGASAVFQLIPITAAEAVPEGEPDVEAGGTAFPQQGYWLFTADGQVFNHGEAQFYGSAANMGKLAAPIISAAPSADGQGYYLVGADGGVFTYGSAKFFGSEGGQKLNSPVVSIIPDSTGNGYWLVARDGGVFAFGDATYQGSEGGTKLNAPVVGGAAYGSSGYYLVATDGGIFSFGGAPFDGSTGNIKLNKPVNGMAIAPGGGYYLVATDGGIFAFGGAPFYGSTGATKLNAPVVSIVPASGGSGYRLVGEDGGIFSFGGAEYDGSEGASGLGNVFVAAATQPAQAG